MMLPTIQTPASKLGCLTTVRHSPTSGTPQLPCSLLEARVPGGGQAWRFPWEGPSLYPPWAAESEDTQGPHWALSTLPPTRAAPTCPLWERWRWWSSALMVSGAGCGSMFYKGWGPCPLLPVAPPGAPPAWLLGGVPWSSSGVTS